MSKHRICEVADVRSEKVHIIAEAGVNHNGKLDLAYKLIDKAAEANVDAIKFQTFTNDKNFFFHENIFIVFLYSKPASSPKNT